MAAQNMFSSEGNLTKDEIEPLNENKTEQQEEEKEEVKVQELENDISIEPATEHKSKCPILHPYGAFKIGWDLLVSIVIIISAIELPLTMAFDIPQILLQYWYNVIL